MCYRAPDAAQSRGPDARPAMPALLPEAPRRQFLRTSLSRALALAGLASLPVSPDPAFADSVPGRNADRMLRIGLAADVTSMDPHWNNSGPNNAMALHVFESLVLLDQDARYIPG